MWHVKHQNQLSRGRKSPVPSTIELKDKEDKYIISNLVQKWLSNDLSQDIYQRKFDKIQADFEKFNITEE